MRGAAVGVATGAPVAVGKSCFFVEETSTYLLGTFRGVPGGFFGATKGGGVEGGGVASGAETFASLLDLIEVGFIWRRFPDIEKGRMTSGAV